ncbi:MAG TPA: ATP-binding protein [Anaerolineae bacterium]
MPLRATLWRSLRLRLLVGSILVVVVAVGVTAVVASQRTLSEFEHYVNTSSASRFHRFAEAMGRSYTANQGWSNIQPDVDRSAAISGQRVVVANTQGKIVGDSGMVLIGTTASAAWARTASPIVVAGTRVGTLYLDPVSGPNLGDLAFVRAINRSALFGALVAILAAIAITLVLARGILLPVERLTAAARRVKTGDLAVQVPIDSQDELGELARAFNAMAGGLAQQEQLRRSMVEDIAHELRTPLTNLRGYLEAARDGLVDPDQALVDNLYEETMLLQRLVVDLQDLALAEAGQLTFVRQEARLAAIAEQAVSILRPQVEAKGVSLGLELPADLPSVDVDPERIGQVLRNLLYNAFLHTSAGGRISVSACVQAKLVAVSVIDTGSGISATDLPHVFDRFYRTDKSRARRTGGAGLGLAIVRQLVVAQGGEITVTSQVGKGSNFTFTVPICTDGTT